MSVAAMHKAAFGPFSTYRGTLTKSALGAGADVGMGQALVHEFTA
jgi:hypothetical protein